jgi:hypothetical protein
MGLFIFPARWFDGLCRALLGDEFVLPPSLRELAAKAEPGWATFASAKLSTSNGCQDHTVLPYATSPLVRRGKQSLTARKTKLVAALQSLTHARRCRVHRFPHSTYRDDAYAPLHEAGWREEGTNLGKTKADYFSRSVWTTQISLNRLVKFGCARTRLRDRCDVATPMRANRFARQAIRCNSRLPYTPGFVGWVERSETHHRGNDEFRFATRPEARDAVYTAP